MAWPILGLSLAYLTPGAVTAAPALPTGGRVIAGSAVIGARDGGSMTVRQSTGKAIIDWAGFSIGPSAKVAFQNGSGATLNRVTGASVSSLDGLLTASGSVYLINPNGVIIGRSGRVDVGGTFVASTLDTADTSFLSGGPLTFAGPSTTAVVNYGRIGSLGGDVALVATTVANSGQIDAPDGDLGLLAGSRVLLSDASLDQGRFSVLLGGPATRVINSGLIQAADAELRAEGGAVYALAGDTAGVIRATGVKSGGGRVWLVASGGSLDLAGTVEAQGAGGTAGAVETSGGTVSLGRAEIDAHGGKWLVDPDDLTIDSTAASTITAALNSGTSVVEQTTASGYSGAGVARVSGKGDIIVAAPLSWSTTAGLTLSAYRNVDVNAPVTVTGGGALTIITGNSGAGDGGALLFSGGSVQFTGVAGGRPAGSLSIGSGSGSPTPYTLVADLATLSADIAANNAGVYALAKPIDASRLSYTTVPLASTETTPFAGVLEGLGNSISNLTINDATDAYVGLFGQTAARSAVRDLDLLEGAVGVGSSAISAGGLAGLNAGTVAGVYSTGAVTSTTVEGGEIGGLAGFNQGLITSSHSAASIVNGAYAGGLVGSNSGKMSDVHASGEVEGGGFAGGLVGGNDGLIRDAYATGAIVGVGHVGGLASYNTGEIMEAYASGAVSGPFPGGLLSSNSGEVVDVYATGSVTGPFGGGLVSNTSGGSIASAYASGKVSGGVSGGFAYSNRGAITDAYYDQGSTGQTIGVGEAGDSQAGVVAVGGDTGLSPYAQATYKAFTFGAGGAWFLREGGTRPFLRSEYSTSIDNAHQLQLIDMDLTADYRLVGVVDASETSGLNPSGMWSPAGFVPLGGSQDLPFTGLLDGRGNAIDGLSILPPRLPSAPSAAEEVGLFQEIGGSGRVLDLTLDAVNVSGISDVGAVAGVNLGVLSGVHANGVVAGYSIPASSDQPQITSSDVGGLVGRSEGVLNQVSYGGAVSGDLFVGGLAGETENNDIGIGSGGSITDSYSTATVKGTDLVGGLVGASDFASISTSYASGPVEGASGSATGGLVGSSFAGSVVDSYWDVGTTGQAVGVGPNDYGGSATQTNVVGIGGGSGISPYASYTYSGFDFSQTGPWRIVEGATRPLLLSEYSTTLTNAHQVQLIDLDLAANYVVGTDIDMSAATRPSDVWSAAGFDPIGDGVFAPFIGALDGQGHTLANLFEKADFYAGLFTDAFNSVIQNVHLSNVDLTSKDSAGALVTNFTGLIRNVSAEGRVQGVGQAGSGSGVGGLVGANGGVISGATANVAVSGASGLGGLAGANDGTIVASVSTGPVNGVSYLGGFVGENSGVISSSYATGAVVGSSGKGPPGRAYYIGGFVGENQPSPSTSITSTLTNDYATGAVSGDGLVGGFAGGNFMATVSHSYATGAVTGTAGDGTLNGIGARVGGFIGENVGVLDADFATGPVSGTTQVGGFAGINAYGPITNSYAVGQVLTVSAAGAKSGAGTLMGGLAGENDGSIAASYATGAVVGFGQIGGLIGRNDASGEVASSYATGQVSAMSGKGAPAGAGGEAGGLVGDNAGQVADAYATGRVSGASGKGGFVGLNEQGGSIATSYATGAGGYGFAGVNRGSLTYDVFDEGAAGIAIGVGSGSSTGLTAIGGSTGLSPDQASSYAGFDFTNVWAIDPGSSRPFLRAGSQAPPPS